MKGTISGLSAKEEIALSLSREITEQNQVDIAKHGSKKSKINIILFNRRLLVKDAVEILWKERGYVLKLSLIEAGYMEEEHYIPTYEKYKNKFMTFSGCSRMIRAFLKCGKSEVITYPDRTIRSFGCEKTSLILLNRIFEDISCGQYDLGFYGVWIPGMILDHPNIDTELCIKVGARYQTLFNKANLKLIELYNEEKALVDGK